MDELWLVGRILFCIYFIAIGAGQLNDVEGSTRYTVGKGIGPARPVVIASSVAFIVGGLSVLFGIWGDLGALLLIVTLLPLTFVLHRFWAERDPAARATETAMFLKNLALIGGCVLLFSFFARDTFGLGLPYTITDGAFSLR